MAWLAALFWRVLDMSPRGHSLDPLVGRLNALKAVLWGLRTDRAWLTGAGPEATERLLQRYGAIHLYPMPSGALFNEPAQLVYEYGVLGALALLTLVAQVAPHLRPGDPWSAAWVIGAVLSCTHWPARLPMTGTVMLAITARGFRVGETHHRAKRTDDDVNQVLELRDAGLSYGEIVAKFDDVPGGVSKSWVRDVCTGRIRAQVPEKFKRARSGG